MSMMPGGFASAFAANGRESKPFVGGGVHLAPRFWWSQTDAHKASLGALFVEAALYRARADADSLAAFDLGGTLGFERNPTRRFLLPYFGGALGYLTHKTMGASSFVYALGGLHLIWHPNLTLALQAGYLFPFHHVDVLRGARVDLSARFSLW